MAATTSSVHCSSFSSDLSQDQPLTRSRSIKKYAKKLSNILTPVTKLVEDDTDTPYSANTTPPLDRFSFPVTSPRPISSPRRAMSSSKKAFAAFKESWNAGINPKQYKQERAIEISSPRYAPISYLQQAEDRRRAEQAAVELTPGRLEYLLYVRDGSGLPVEYCDIVETMWSRPEEQAIFVAHAVMVDEGSVDARCFF